MSFSVWQEKMTSISNDSTLTPRTQRDTRRMNWFVSIAAAVAGLLFGLDIGVISGALPFITDHFTLSSQLQEWVVSSMMLGAAIGALFNGWLSFRLGRKYSLMAGACSLLPALSAPLLPPAWRCCWWPAWCWGGRRDRLLYRAAVPLRNGQRERARENDQYVSADGDLGIVLAFLSDTAFSYSGNWRAMLGVLALPAVILIILVVFLPNSPRWLAEKGAISKRKRCCGCCAIPRKRRATSLTRSAKA
jgi:SP family arabinose:H+ symporter-like MFS transporter